MSIIFLLFKKLLGCKIFMAKYRRGHIRNAVMLKTFYILSKSAVARIIFILIISAFTSIITTRRILLSLPCLWFAFSYRYIIFELLVLHHVIDSSLGKWDWYNQVDDDIYLGSIPMESMAHRSVIALDLKVESVISILEDYEFNCTTLAGSPVQPEDWKRDDIRHLHLKSKDFFPPPFSVLDEGADWINSQVITGKKVYCHCKSGIGRSASVIMAYFMKYRRMSVSAAYNELKSRRPAIFGPQSAQMKNMRAYEACKKSPSSFS